MSHNGISYIGRYAFKKNDKLYSLIIYGHKLSVFPTHFGGAAQNITYLEMKVSVWHPNDMESIQLLNFSRLNFLALNRNRIKTGNLKMESLPALKQLYVSECTLQVFPDLSVAPALRIVQLHFNNFSEIPAFSIRNLLKLRIFAFMGCRVTHLPDLSHLVKLNVLFISDNKLIAIPDIYHLPLTRIEWTGNPMDCSKSLCWVRMWNYTKPWHLLLDTFNLESQLKCASPPEMAGIRMMDVHPVTMKCFAGNFNHDQRCEESYCEVMAL